MKESGYTIRTMARRCGMTAHTLRYYERVGLIKPVGRAQNGHRRYSDADEKWLRFLRSLRATNMPIREIQRYATLNCEGDSTNERRNILEGHRLFLETQIANLQEAHGILSHNIESLELSTEMESAIPRESFHQELVDSCEIAGSTYRERLTAAEG